MTALLYVLVGLAVGFGFGRSDRTAVIQQRVVECTAERPCQVEVPGGRLVQLEDISGLPGVTP